MPSLPGVDSRRLFTLRTVEDALAIAGFIDTHAPRTATVVGGGFIGLEMAENLVERGLEVSVVQRGSHVMPTLDEDMASVLHNSLRSHGVHLVLNAAVTRFEEIDGDTREGMRANADDGPGETTGAGVATNTGEGGHILTHVNGRAPLASDIVVLAVGVTPDSGLARDTGLELGLRGSILVDEHMRTSDPDIYAVGDAVQVTNVVTDQPALIALAGPANKQGHIAADNICGIESTFAGSQGSSVMKCFDVTVATTGLTEKAARAAGLTCDAAILTPPSHATYYPGSHPLVLKVVFERPGGRILGAQAIGREGIDKRIGVLAVAIRARMTAHDLTELDLAYAPPYSSAKDPMNMAGYVIENLLDGLVEQVRWQEALDLPEGLHAARHAYRRRIRARPCGGSSARPARRAARPDRRAAARQNDLRVLPKRPAQLPSLPHPRAARACLQERRRRVRFPGAGAARQDTVPPDRVHRRRGAVRDERLAGVPCFMERRRSDCASR